MRTEDDIRAAFRSLARQAPDADAVLTAVREQLEIASAGPRLGGRRPARRRMAPLAAAAAVIAVTATAVAVAGGQMSHRPSASAASGLNLLPRYYLTLASTHRDRYGATVRAVVKDTVTGATLATVNPPAPFDTFAGVAGAADDRTFVLAAQGVRARSRAGAPIKLYRAVYHPATAAITLTPLPIPEIPAGDILDGLALSPGGTSLAVGLSTPAGRHGRQQMRVYSLPSGAAKIWQQSPSASYFTFRPSFARSGLLAFNWAGRPASGTWLLRTGTSGGSLTGNSQLAAPAEMGRYAVVGGVLSGDGSIITAVATTGLRIVHLDGRPAVSPTAKIVQFSVQTGRVIRTLWRSRYAGESVLWSSSSGDVLVVQAYTTRSDGHPAIGVLHGSRFTPIPGLPTGMPNPDPAVGLGPALAF